MAGMNEKMMVVYPSNTQITEKHVHAQTTEECINCLQTKELTLAHVLTNLYIQPTASCKLFLSGKRRMSLWNWVYLQRLAGHTVYVSNRRDITAEPPSRILKISQAKQNN